MISQLIYSNSDNFLKFWVTSLPTPQKSEPLCQPHKKSGNWKRKMSCCSQGHWKLYEVVADRTTVRKHTRKPKNQKWNPEAHYVANLIPVPTVQLPSVVSKAFTIF